MQKHQQGAELSKVASLSYIVDTCVWIDHFRQSNQKLVEALNTAEVYVHPLVTMELACGSLKSRTQILRLLDRLSPPQLASNEEVRILIENETLFSKGVGPIDMHLVATCRLNQQMALWTTDKRLISLAKYLSIDCIN